MKRALSITITGLALSLAVFSQSAAAADGAQLYQTKTCLTCHGKDGKTPLLPTYPKVAGQNAAYAAQQMRDIKSGARANGMSAGMKGIMGLVSDAEIDALAKYIETMDP